MGGTTATAFNMARKPRGTTPPQCAEPASAPAPPQYRTASAPRRGETVVPEGNFELCKDAIYRVSTFELDLILPSFLKRML
jgi:hypothetical protein